MFNRRTLLLTGAAALAGCASATPVLSADPAADAEIRTLVERLNDRSRITRPFLLRRFDATRLSPAGRILYDAVLPGAEADAALAQRTWGKTGAPYAVTHRAGAYRRASEMREGDNQRMAAREVQRDTNRLEGDAARGVIAPDFVLSAAITAVEEAQARVATAPDERDALSAALGRQLDTLRAFRERSQPDPGMWRLPDGEAFYAQTLQYQLGAAVQPREAHAQALDRCRQLQAEADTLLRAQGLTRGDVGERLRSLVADTRYGYGTDKARAIADMNARLTRTRALLADVLEDAADAPSEIRLLPANLEANGAQGRRQGSVYFVDMGADRPLWTLPSVAHHETLPGHIYQAPYEGAADAPDLQLRYAGGYSEGWATYAEQMVDEAGAYADDPLARIGYLQWMLFRYGRVVADTGIHAMRWSRERAITELRTLQGDSVAFVSIDDDVLRYCVQPGAYPAQGLAALHIGDLRDRTRRAARDRFSLRAFHAAMLQHGPLSPPGLEQAARAAFG